MYAVITGSSKGFGKEFAAVLASLGYDLLLVARSAKLLSEVQRSLTKEHAVKIDTYPCDLTIDDELEKLMNIIKSEKVDLLINNAGFGVQGDFAQTSLTHEKNMLKLNINVLHILTKQVLQQMQLHKSGRIINIASLAAFTPVPQMASYGATKAYVQSLSLAVNYEQKLRRTGVRVVSICPGAFATQFFKSESMGAKNPRYASKKVSLFAQRALHKALETRKPTVLVGSGKILAFLMRIVPQKLSAKVAAKSTTVK